MDVEPLSGGSGKESAPVAPPPKYPRNVHVLFVHGVGRHSRLSSLLHPYQSVRSDLRSPETPVGIEDQIPGWRLEGFEDDATPPYLKMVPRFAGVIAEQPEAVYFYEVNYSSLAGVVRENHPLDMTRLFVGFDLAANAARARQKNTSDSAWPLDHPAIAAGVQKISGVLAAATVPLLGLPALLLRNYTHTLVSTFTRFFEDIATFAMDKDGEQLISAHVDRTVARIVDTKERFCAETDRHAQDVFVIAAHSLGSVVSHNYLVRHWEQGGPGVPATLLTFGSPVGLICWLWLYLDYPGMKFDPDKNTGRNYFCWSPKRPSHTVLQAVYWINVVNHLDPIATAFPARCADLLRSPEQVRAALDGWGIDTRYIRTGDALSAGSAHTAYFDDRAEFQKILTLVAGLRSREKSDHRRTRTESMHWPQMLGHLRKLRIVTWLLGAAVLLAYFVLIARAFGDSRGIVLMAAYLYPPATVGLLAFFQRLLFGGATKRTRPQDCWSLPLLDLAALPYRLRVPNAWLWLLFRVRLRQLWRRRSNWRVMIRHRVPWPYRAPDVVASPGLPARVAKQIAAFLPTLVIAIAPALLAHHLSGAKGGLPVWIADHPGWSLGLFGLFFVYLILFAVSEFVANWRRTLSAVLKR